METKELKITCPDGYEIDKEKSTFECIVFKPIKKELPKTWEEFCKTHPIKGGESYFNPSSMLITFNASGNIRYPGVDKNLLPSRELAEAILVLCQLIQLRDCYNNGWKPDWTDSNEDKYTIVLLRNTPITECYTTINRILSFKTAELRDQFLENFRDLIETAKPLL